MVMSSKPSERKLESYHRNMRLICDYAARNVQKLV
jgi:hypothetical protein